MRQGAVCLCALLFVLALVAPAGAASDSSGVDFWLAFPANHSGPELSLFITGDTNTTGTVEIPGLDFSALFSVTVGQVTTVPLPTAAQVDTSDTVERKGIHVTAQSNVTVYGLNRIVATTDAYLGLPTALLGTEYINLGYFTTCCGPSEFAVVGTEAGTRVTISPSADTGNHAAGVPYTITLAQGETYQLQNSGADLSGTIISATKPIAVFGGNQCTDIPSADYFACDHIVEQLPPTVTWGKNFVTMPLATRLNGDTFRFLASVDGTRISVNGTVVATLNRGQYHQQIIDGPAQITADQPILVAQYSNSSSYDNVTSDPFMLLIPPFEQFLGRYTVTTPASGFSQNFINVVAPTTAVGTITLDGAAIPAERFTAIGSTGFSGAQLVVSLGTHTLAGPAAFGVFVYGFDSYDSYGYPGGLSLAPVATVTHVALAPKTATQLVGQQGCLTATVTDQRDRAVAGVRVDFGVTGANATSGFASTDASGQAQFCYTGANAGDDAITAAVGTLSDTAAKTWATVATSLSVAPASGTYGGAATLSATLAPGRAGETISFALNGAPAGTAVTDASGVATTAPISLGGLGAGTYPIVATFAGGHGYAASSGTGTLTVTQAAQTIAFVQPGDRTAGDAPFTASATASSGLPVTFTAGPVVVCAAGGTNGATITLVGTGTCTVIAHQAGDANFAAAPDVSRSFTVVAAAAQVTLTLTTGGSGTVAISPAGTTVSPTARGYSRDTLVTLAPQPAADQIFIGWTVDGQAKGWARPLTITMNTSHIVEATFVPTPHFGDFPPGDPAIQPVIEEAARGYIRGCDQTVTPPSFCSARRIKRAEMAALIVRALGWTGQPSINPFTDRCDPANPADCIDQELWDAIGILVVKGVARGYSSDADCGGPGTAPCFAPRNEVTYGQVLLFISRAMTAQGYWLGPLADITTLFPELPQGTEAERQDRLSIVAYVFFAGAPPDVDASPGQPFASIGTPSTRGWFARALWQALDSYWGVDLPKNHGGFVP